MQSFYNATRAKRIALVQQGRWEKQYNAAIQQLQLAHKLAVQQVQVQYGKTTPMQFIAPLQAVAPKQPSTVKVAFKQNTIGAQLYTFWVNIAANKLAPKQAIALAVEQGFNKASATKNLYQWVARCKATALV